MTRWSVNRKILVAFGSGLLALVLTGIISYRNALQLLDTGRWVEHTHTVLRELDQVDLSIATVESAVRGYILTGDTSFLGPYEGNTAQVTSHLQNLKDLTADNPVQQRRLPLLESHVASKLAIQQL